MARLIPSLNLVTQTSFSRSRRAFKMVCAQYVKKYLTNSHQIQYTEAPVQGKEVHWWVNNHKHQWLWTYGRCFLMMHDVEEQIFDYMFKYMRTHSMHGQVTRTIIYTRFDNLRWARASFFPWHEYTRKKTLMFLVMAAQIYTSTRKVIYLNYERCKVRTVFLALVPGPCKAQI